MVKMTLGSSTSQGASASSISQQRVSAYEALIGSLQNFGGEEGLTGAAYDSAKNYATSILVPLLQGAILLSEGIGQAVPRLPQKYQAEVGGEDLDSAVLESEIAAYNSSLRSQHNLLRMLSSADEISPSAIQRVSQGITNTTKLRNDAMEKLQKLNAFANSSNSVFDGVVSDVEGAVQAGLAEIGSSFASFNGTFSSSSPSWVKKIGVEWRKKEEIDKNYQKVLKRLEDGKDPSEQDIKAIQAYAERYPNRVSEDIKKGLKTNNFKNLHNIFENLNDNLNPFQTELWGNKIGIGTPDIYSYTQYGRSILRKWRNNPGSFNKGTVFSRGGAQISDLKIFGKSFKNNSKIGKIVSKLPSYEHGTINRDLNMMKENTKSFSAMSKVGKAFKVASWVGTALDVSSSFTELKAKGFSNEQSVAVTARRTAVDLASSTVGSNVGRLAGAAIGQAVIPIPGVGAAIGALAGSVIGGTIGGWVGSAINKHLDSNIKPRKEGWSWPW